MPSYEMPDAFWEQHTAFPLDKKVVRLHAGIQCAQIALREGEPVFELSTNRRINHFEANAEQFSDWLDRLSDDIVAEAEADEFTPDAIVYYGPRTIGSFAWEAHGFAVIPGAPLPGDLLQHPVDRQPLDDEPTSARQAITAVIETIDLLSISGYEA